MNFCYPRRPHTWREPRCGDLPTRVKICCKLGTFRIIPDVQQSSDAIQLTARLQRLVSNSRLMVCAPIARPRIAQTEDRTQDFANCVPTVSLQHLTLTTKLASPVGISPHSKFGNVTSEPTHLTLRGHIGRRVAQQPRTLSTAVLLSVCLRTIIGPIIGTPARTRT